MPDRPTNIWKNLRHMVSALIEAGLVAEFRGVFEQTGAARVEVRAAKLGDEVYPPSDIFEQFHNGFYAKSEFAELSRSRNYTVRFVDGAIAQYFCIFDENTLVRQRLTYFQSPLLQPYDSKAGDYDEWMSGAEDLEQEMQTLFAHEVFRHRSCVNLRLEYAPDSVVPLLHPATHLHLGDAETCRIPVTSPLGVASFFRWIVKNFYAFAWDRVNAKLADPMAVDFDRMIDDVEEKEVHICC